MGRLNQLRATIRQTKKKSMWIGFEAIIDDWGQFVSRLLNGISLGAGRNLALTLLVYEVMTYWTRIVVAVNVVKPIIKTHHSKFQHYSKTKYIPHFSFYDANYINLHRFINFSKLQSSCG